MDKTRPFYGCDAGSIPAGGTKLEKKKKTFLWYK